MGNTKRALFQKEEELKRSRLLLGTELVLNVGGVTGSPLFPTPVKPLGNRKVSPASSIPTAPVSSGPPLVPPIPQVPGLTGSAIACDTRQVPVVNFVSPSKYHVPRLPMIAESVPVGHTAGSGVAPPRLCRFRAVAPLHRL